jgi:hypothetical protein
MDPLKECISEALRPLLGSQELIDMWWKSQNRAFEFKTPEEVFKINPQRVAEYVRGQYR